MNKGFMTKMRQRMDLELRVLTRQNLMEQERWEKILEQVLEDAAKLPAGWEREITADTNLLLKGNPLHDRGFIPEEAATDDPLYYALNRLWKHLAWFLRKNASRPAELRLARAA